MEDLDEIEDFSSKQVENLDQEFIDRLKDIKDDKKKDELGKEYYKRLLKIKKEYEDKVALFLKGHKSFGFEKEEKQKKEEEPKDENELDMSKPFKAKGVDIERTRRDTFRERMEMLKFKNRIKTKDFFDKAIPDSVKISEIKTRNFVKRSMQESEDRASKAFSNMGEGFSDLFGSVKDSLKSFTGKMKGLSDSIKNIMKKVFKKKGKKGEGDKEDSEKKSDENVPNDQKNT